MENPRHISNNWRFFWLLLGAGLFGSACVVPYALALIGDKVPKLPLPLPAVLALQTVQALLLLALFVGVGLLLAPKVGLGAPYLERWINGGTEAYRGLPFAKSVAAGVGVGLAIVTLAVFVFLPLLPHVPSVSETAMPIWKRLLACFYGGINEEIACRLFLMTFFLWLVSKVWPSRGSRPNAGAFWAVNTFVALLFALGHFPAAMQIMPITPIVAAYLLSLNALGGFVFVYLYWKSVLEADMIAHFSCDMVLHVIAPIFVKS
jgi:hypothetical protein